MREPAAVIRCHRVHLEQRCRERGYTLEQARPCIVSETGNDLVVDEMHPSYPRARPGLGDMVASGLAAVGITKERVSKVLGKPCNCPARQAALNRLGSRLFGLPEGQNRR